MTPTPPFQLHEWIIRPDLNRVDGPEVSHQLEPRVMQVLDYLASKPGQVVTRQELLERVWQDMIVGDEALTRAISELRRVFADDVRAPRFVETIRKSGYRLVADVRPLAETPPTAPPRAGRRAWPWIAVVAVSLVALAAWWYLASHDGGDARPGATPLLATPFTSYPGEEITPAISPGGTRVAFAWRGADDANLDIYVKQANSDTPLRLTHDPGVDVYPAWSPDGETLAFVHSGDSGAGIYTIPAIGGEPRKLFDARGWLGGHSWAPDGASLVYAENPDPESRPQLFLYEFASGERRPLTPLPDLHIGDYAPVFSPDGERVAFVRVDGAGMQDIYVASVESGESKRLTRALLWVRGLDWARDGRSLICSTFTNGAYGLWRVDAEDGRMSWVPTRGEWVYSPTVSRHADRMVYQDLWFEKNIWAVRRHADPTSGLSTAPLISSSRWDCEAYYSPDGERLVFTSARSGHLEIWTCASDGSRPMQLTFFEGAYVGRPRWSPNGERIAFYACPNGFGDLYVVDADGGRPHQITRTEANELMACWSRDGRSIYFASDRGGEWDLWKLPSASGDAEPVQVTKGGGIAGYETPDGSALLYARPERSGLWRLPLDASTPPAAEPLLEDLPEQGDWGNWSLFRDGIVLVRRDNEGPQLVQYDFNTRQIEPIARVPNIAAPSLAVSPDGRSILYARVENSVGDLMLVDGFR
ncbi:MAG: PD40 domain-containing protein [Candidatus Latescibacterota bacterium]|nr:MAG: PD40 domain-containing protein [Candidatus Latescibacterota bacterium]